MKDSALGGCSLCSMLIQWAQLLLATFGDRVVLSYGQHREDPLISYFMIYDHGYSISQHEIFSINSFASDLDDERPPNDSRLLQLRASPAQPLRPRLARQIKSVLVLAFSLRRAG